MAEQESLYHIRKAERPNQLSTYEATGRAIAQLDPQIPLESTMAVFSAFLETSIKADPSQRNQPAKSEAWNSKNKEK